jgi:polyisoprenyl-phosphate glycosyltransferase
LTAPTANPDSPELSVVVPVYGCASCLPALHARLHASIEPIADRFELIFVDDRSTDGAWNKLVDIARRDPAVKAYRLSRNFGQHAAITAGLSRSSGRWTVVMDCDLQEAPEEIPRLYAATQEGYEIVRTVRRERQHAPARRWASHLFRSLTGDDPDHPDYSTLSMISRGVVEAFMRLRDRDREYMLALDWLGFDQTTIEIEHAERFDGRSGYTLRRLVRVALDGMFFRTTVLLRLVVLLGFLIALAGVALAIYVIVDHLRHNTVPGYTSLAVLIALASGFIIVSVGVVGLYVGRIFEQVKDRPLFIIDAEVSAASPLASEAETPVADA